ncbi:MAG: thioredoxin domain-containing protein [Candidatus Obscuribacterales bacterium]|nr:thioredoxin domain-containing protein [Candidatus Obscuribacterales bacterium]
MSQNDSLKSAKEKTANRANKLLNESSTYLLQHAYNPVDWYPWGEEALKRARDEDKPILLSIGYSACHWCHVMEHESFEDESTAEIMNRNFINIKVDREERPDLDEIYMKSVQLLTGHGGWPMTVFLTPELKPFYAGTYFPPEDRHGMPSFKRVMSGVKNAWEKQRQDVEESSADITKHLSMLDKVSAGQSELNDELLEKALEPLLKVFDRQWGGFGGAPKFPHAASLSFAMRSMKPGSDQKTSKHLLCLELITTTLNRMAWGGIHDQLAGGFARYSVDRRWLIPHFEKMLYDNALIPRNYFDGYLITSDKYWLEVGKATLDFVLRELLMPEGAFYCSLDADSEGEEGKFYVWTPEQIEAALGKEDAEFFCAVLDVTKQGNFEHGRSALNFPEGPDLAMSRFQMSGPEFRQRLNPLKERLLAEREKRVRPGRDDKMLTSWSSLMISCLLDGYRVSGDRNYLDAALKAADFILNNLWKDGRLLRTYGRGIAKLNAYLEDYAYLIQALLDLAACDASPRWFKSAELLNDFVLTHFWDEENAGFFYTSDEHEELIARTKHFYDGSTPSSSSVSAMNLIRLSRLKGDLKLMNYAERTIKLYSSFFHKAPDQFSNMLCALDSYNAQALEIAVLFDDSTKAQAEELLSVIYRTYLPNAVLILSNLSASDNEQLLAACPLLRERPLQNSLATVYICRNFSCQKPIVDKNALAQELASLQKSQ